MSRCILQRNLKNVTMTTVASVRTKFVSENFQRTRTRNTDKYWGRVVEDGEGVVPGRTVARIRNRGSIWPGANVDLQLGRWENTLKARAVGQVRYHREVVEGKERSYVSIDRIYHPHPTFILDKVISKEENLKNGPIK